MSPSTAEKDFMIKLRDFCRAHRSGRRIDPAMARAALDWEAVFDERLNEPVLLVAEDKQTLSGSGK
jgi:hypothetical protein